MLTYQPLNIISINAAQSDIKKNRFISFSGSYCEANSKALGVSDADTSRNEILPVITSGIALVIAGDPLALGQAVTSNAEGCAIPAAPFNVSLHAGAVNVTSNNVAPDIIKSGGILPQAINGYALDTAYTHGQLIRVLLS